MPLVVSPLADLVVDDTAPAILRGECRVAHLHFRDRVEDRSVDHVVAHWRTGGGAVQQGVGERHASVYRYASHTWVAVVGPVAARARQHGQKGLPIRDS